MTTTTSQPAPGQQNPGQKTLAPTPGLLARLGAFITRHATWLFADPQVQGILDQTTDIVEADDRFDVVIPPQPGMSISPDEHTGILIAGAAEDTDAMVAAVDDLKDDITALSTSEIEVFPTGQSALWSDFNKANHDAMIKAEMFS